MSGKEGGKELRREDFMGYWEGVVPWEGAAPGWGGPGTLGLLCLWEE